jgi:hypothetical protein
MNVCYLQSVIVSMVRNRSSCVFLRLRNFNENPIFLEFAVVQVLFRSITARKKGSILNISIIYSRWRKSRRDCLSSFQCGFRIWLRTLWFLFFFRQKTIHKKMTRRFDFTKRPPNFAFKLHPLRTLRMSNLNLIIEKITKFFLDLKDLSSNFLYQSQELKKRAENLGHIKSILSFNILN